MRSLLVALIFSGAWVTVVLVEAAELKWTGMRNPCKQSAEDGLTDKQLAKKIGKFIVLPSKDAWAQAIFNVNNRFPGSRPWATWSVGEVKDAVTISDEVQEAHLVHMDRLGIEIFLEVAPTKTGDVAALIDTWLTKFQHHPSIKGFAVDLEFYRRVDDAAAKAWDEKIKSFNPRYRLLLKHWEQRFMPPTYRSDLIFVNTSSEATIDALNTEFAQWADHFAPAAVAFQIGYPSDEDGMDGKSSTGWWKLKDPIKDWGDDLRGRIKSPTQEVGLLWVCAKSGKTYNAQWDLTMGAKVPRPRDDATSSSKRLQ